MYFTERYFVVQEVNGGDIVRKHELTEDILPFFIRGISFNMKEDVMLILSTASGNGTNLKLIRYDVITGVYDVIKVEMSGRKILFLPKIEGFKAEV